MLYLVTGLPQTGKTYNTVQWVLEHSQRSQRPVCHNGRFVAPEGRDLSGWKKIDPKDWQQEEGGTLFFLDACHHDFPARRPGQEVPDYIKSLVLHDREGMDFYLITQHPGSVDNFVLDLVQSPGWHRHLRRTGGGHPIRCLEWSQVNLLCERDESELGALVTTISLREDGSLHSRALSARPRGARSSSARPSSARRNAKRPATKKPRVQAEGDEADPSAALAGAAKVAAHGGKAGVVLAGRGLRGLAIALKKLALAAGRWLKDIRTRTKAQAQGADDYSHIRPAAHSYSGDDGGDARRFSMKTALLIALLLGAGAWAWIFHSGDEPIALPQALQDVSLPDIALPDINLFGGDGEEASAPPSAASSVPKWTGSTEGLSCVLKDKRCGCFDAQGKKVEVPTQVCRDVVNREGV